MRRGMRAGAGISRRTFLQGSLAGAAVLGLGAPTVLLAQSREELVIAMATSLSGPLAFLGRSTAKGAELAVDEWNTRGGAAGRRIRMSVGDSGDNPMEAAAFIRRVLAMERAPVVTGIIRSDISLAARPLLEEQKIPGVMVMGATNQLITQGTRYVFRTTGSDRQFNIATAQFFKAKGSRRIAVIVEDSSYGRDSLKDFAPSARALGLTIVFEKATPIGETNFLPVLNELKPLNPDAVYLVSPGTPSVFASRQMNEIGLKPAITLGVYASSLPFYAAALKELVVGQYAWSRPTKGAHVEAFERGYRAKHKEAPNIFSCYGYDNVQIIAQAVARANSLDPRAIRDALARTDYEGVVGYRIQFTPNGASKLYRLYVGRWEKTPTGYEILEDWRSEVVPPDI